MNRLFSFLVAAAGLAVAIAAYTVYVNTDDVVKEPILIKAPVQPAAIVQSAPSSAAPVNVDVIKNAEPATSSSSQQSSSAETNDIVAQPDRPGAAIDRNRAAADAQAAARAYYQQSQQ